MYDYQKTNEDTTHEPFNMKRTKTMFINHIIINKLPNPELTKGNEKICACIYSYIVFLRLILNG
jgi:hypothetical protein